jgi:hypothetical protein
MLSPANVLQVQSLSRPLLSTISLKIDHLTILNTHQVQAETPEDKN